MYFLQRTLFSFEEWLEFEPDNRIDLFFKALDLSPYISKLKNKLPQGAKGYDCGALLRALLIAPVEGISTFTALHQRLKSDIRLKYQCGFSLTQNVPSISTFSRFFKKVTEMKLAEEIYYDLVIICREKGLILGKEIAIDSSALDAYEEKRPKARSKDTGNASWGAKLDSFRNKITWFGYKIHLAVDAASELPVALEVTPAHINDGDMAPPLMERVYSQATEKIIDYFILDAGYDQSKNYKKAKELGAQAIIPLNLRNEKEPPAGFSSTGTPRCSMGFDMVYWGKDKNYLKFRCPHVLGKVDCIYGSAWCSYSNYGLVTKINVNDDLRRFSIPHRDSKDWEYLYKKRTSVERSFSRFKESLTVNDLHVGGIEKVTTYTYLNGIILLVVALAADRESKSVSAAA